MRLNGYPNTKSWSHVFKKMREDARKVMGSSAMTEHNSGAQHSTREGADLSEKIKAETILGRYGPKGEQQDASNPTIDVQA